MALQRGEYIAYADEDTIITWNGGTGFNVYSCDTMAEYTHFTILGIKVPALAEAAAQNWIDEQLPSFVATRQQETGWQAYQDYKAKTDKDFVEPFPSWYRDWQLEEGLYDDRNQTDWPKTN